jgi:hypothetical protein
MSIKISELPSASSVGSSDVIPIVQSGTTKKVTVETMLPTIATSITSSSTNNEVAGAKAVYDYGEKNIMQLLLRNNFNPSANHTYETLPLSLNFSSGSKLTFNSSTHRIIIGTGVKTIKIYAFAGVNTVSVNERKYIQVYKNGTVGGTLNMTYMSATDVRSIQFETFESVTSGDTIELKYYGSLGDNVALNRAMLAVEVVEFEPTTTSSTLNTASLMNTGELVGMGDRAELTTLATSLYNEHVETTEEKTEGSGDTI